MNLSELITELRRLQAEGVSTLIPGLGSPHSWRGDYSEVSFDPIPEGNSVEAALENAEGALGETFTGYKGGEYTMGPYTEVYLADWGELGEPLSPLALRAMAYARPQSGVE